VDSKFKQRLTGAVILILLAVLLVPELLNGPKAPTSGPVSSALGPAQDEGAPLRSYDIDLSDAPQASPPVAPVPADAVPSPAAPAPKVAPSAAATTPRPAAVAAPESWPAVPTPDAGPSISMATATGPALRGFAVQVGSFASRDSADRLTAELGRRRFETFVSPVRSGGRQLYRVRVGPVADRTAAQTLQSRLKATGQRGSVVNLP